MENHMEHLQQLKDFDENLAYEKEVRAQEMQERKRLEVFWNYRLARIILKPSSKFPKFSFKIFFLFVIIVVFVERYYYKHYSVVFIYLWNCFLEILIVFSA